MAISGVPPVPAPVAPALPSHERRAIASPDAVSAAAAGVRPEIQALRALAVGLVVVYHLWPTAVPGGFIGVDVFFAISGFLITSMLLREIDRDGKVRLAAFWARRARRLLPAARVQRWPAILPPPRPSGRCQGPGRVPPWWRGQGRGRQRSATVASVGFRDQEAISPV